MKTCPACQQSYPDEFEYCSRDGAHLAAGLADLRECPYCAEKILGKARVCKHCGRDITQAGKSFLTRDIGCAGVLGVIFLVAGFVFWPFWVLAVLLFILSAIKKK
jgi:ribosomal protein L32